MKDVACQRSATRTNDLRRIQRTTKRSKKIWSWRAPRSWTTAADPKHAADLVQAASPNRGLVRVQDGDTAIDAATRVRIAHAAANDDRRVVRRAEVAHGVAMWAADTTAGTGRAGTGDTRGACRAARAARRRPITDDSIQALAACSAYLASTFRPMTVILNVCLKSMVAWTRSS